MSTLYHPYFRPYVTQVPSYGFGQAETETVAPTGQARGILAGALGCPDRVGMAAMEKGAYRSLCYWIKRPIGAFLLIAVIGGIIYFAFMRK